MQDHPSGDAETVGVDQRIGNVLFDVWLVSRATTALIDDVVRPAGLDADEFAVYSVLAAGDGMTPTELARWMAAPPTTVSSYVKRFEERDHVERVANPEDRRSYRLQLTPVGREAHTAAGALFAPILEQVADLMNAEASDTHRLLLGLRDVVRTVAAGRAGDGST